MDVMESILTSIKKLLGIEAEYTQFDVDIIFHINTAFMTLHQLGVGPSKGFSIEDETTTWSDYLGRSSNLQAVKTYIYLKVRMVFDPPTNPSVLSAMQREAAEYESRLNYYAEIGGVS